MGKRIKLREAQRRATAEAIAARLRAHARPKSNPAFIEVYSGFDLPYREQIEAYRELALRPPEDWRCALRCRSPERRFLELVKFTFARHGVAEHLKSAWIAAPNARHELAAALAADDAPDLRLWYIIAAQGGSLHKEATHRYLTKLETHHFVRAPIEVPSTARAFWYALARTQTDDSEVALKVSRSKLARCPVVAPFWKEVARFFARNPIAILEMNDLTDYLQVALQEDPHFSLKGRSLRALRRRMAEWHRMLQHIAAGGCWNGHPLPDTVYGGGPGAAVWRFRQIKTGEELAREGRRMAHCVATYKDNCIRGTSSIWSLTCEHPVGVISNSVTIELAGDGTIVQCRGYANRGASPNEAAVIKGWAAEHGLIWHDWLW
jgi:PcfJ-like protein